MSENLLTNETKKQRKPRVSKENLLETRGFKTKDCWNQPRLKRYLDDKTRFLSSIKPVYFQSLEKNTLEKIGGVYTFEKGPCKDDILIINNFSIELYDDNAFKELILKYIGNGGDESKLVILSTHVKSWGNEKVIKSTKILSELEKSAYTEETITISSKTVSTNTSKNIFQEKGKKDVSDNGFIESGDITKHFSTEKEDTIMINQMSQISAKSDSVLNELMVKYLDAQQALIKTQKELFQYIQPDSL